MTVDMIRTLEDMDEARRFIYGEHSEYEWVHQESVDETDGDIDHYTVSVCEKSGTYWALHWIEHPYDRDEIPRMELIAVGVKTRMAPQDYFYDLKTGKDIA